VPRSTTRTCTPRGLGSAAVAHPDRVAAFAQAVPIQRYAERANNITHWTDFDRGGRFAAMEVPELFVGVVRDFSGRCVEDGAITPQAIQGWRQPTTLRLVLHPWSGA
jgi:DNA topoisomerase IA